MPAAPHRPPSSPAAADAHATVAPPDARAPRNSRTRKALIEAGKRMISGGQMGGASIDDIVREADVAKGSFFNHFTDRDDLARQVLAQVRADLEASVAAANAGVSDPAMRMTRGLLASLRYGMVHQVGARVMLHEVGDMSDAPHHHPLLVRDLEAGMAQNAFKLDDLEAGMVLVLGLSDLGLSRLLDLRLDFERARSFMQDLCLTMLRSLGVDSRRQERLVEEAMRVVIDAPRLAD